MNYSVHLTSNWLTLKSGDHYLYVRCNRGEHLRESGRKSFQEMLQTISGEPFPEAIMARLGHDEYAGFTLIYTYKSVCLLKTDIIRTYPIFYYRSGSNILISDHVVYNGGQEPDDIALLQFLSTGMVWGEKTVYTNTCALQAGEIVLFHGEAINRNRYFRYIYDATPKWTRPDEKVEACRHFDQVFSTVMQDTVASIPEQGRIVVPLSGGHDSRLLVNYLYRMGYRNVLCFSYGTPGNLQAAISRRVASALGYDWVFAEYNEKKWAVLFENREIERFIEYAFRGVSAPHLQDFLAVHDLKQRQILRTGDVIIPGHALDFIAGSHLSEADISAKTPEDAVNRVLDKFPFNTVPGTREYNVLKREVEQLFKNLTIDPAGFQECFNWQERQAKFIANSLRVYEYFGFEARIPFWDIRVIRYWLSVAPQIKMRRRIFHDMERVALQVDELRHIPFFDEMVHKQQRNYPYRKYIPARIIVSMLRMLKRKQILDEGLNQIFALQADSVGDLIGPLHVWPELLRPLFSLEMRRYPYQYDYHFLTRLYTIRKLIL